MTWTLPPLTWTLFLWCPCQDWLGKPPAHTRRAGACCVPHFPAPDRAFPRGNAVRIHPEPTEWGWSLVTWLVLHLQLTVLFNETCELGTGADVCGISESAAQVE